MNTKYYVDTEQSGAMGAFTYESESPKQFRGVQLVDAIKTRAYGRIYYLPRQLNKGDHPNIFDTQVEAMTFLGNLLLAKAATLDERAQELRGRAEALLTID